MNQLNSIILEGNLTRDGEVKTTSSGTKFVVFSIASNRYYKQGDEFKQEVSFFDVSVWGKAAEYAEPKLKKGRGVRIIGRLKQDRWDQDGQTRSRITVIADRVDFSPEKKQENSDFNSDSF